MLYLFNYKGVGVPFYRERPFPQRGTAVSASGNSRFRKWELSFPQVGTRVSAGGNGSYCLFLI
ncbi:hypothetical protein [uncultured Bacteroides sp.]|uniref:hypothetical protein n=1 Tax=uncultured Bacteroides sp. TaxID=162156 RepID=UPI00280B7280|nr:hypothetical protein [uncultured Bacteroides sp.]